MARARQRYVITGNMKFNGHDLRGQLMVRLGECNWAGRKSKYKRELTHWNVRFEDKKWLKTTSIPVDTIELAKADEGKFYVKAEEYSTTPPSVPETPA